MYYNEGGTKNKKDSLMFSFLAQTQPSQSGETDNGVFKFTNFSPWAIIVVIVILLMYTSVMSLLFYKILSQTKGRPADTLIPALALLTFVLITASIVTGSNGLETIAGTGVGAIAGAVSHKVIGKERNGEDGSES